MSSARPIALVTGAGKRIGRHLALSLAQSGWDIAAHYNSSSAGVDELKALVEGFGQVLLPVQADLSDEQEVRKILPSCVQELGVPSLLVNNASLFEKDDFGTLQGALFDAHMAINLKAPLLLAQDFVSAQAEMKSSAEHANIINITDQRVYRPGTDFASYTISKMGLAGATQMMARALAPSIRVNAIAPGPVLQSIHQSSSEFEAECSGTLLGHGTNLAEIWGAATFILNSHSMTGETLHLDGGQRLQ